MTLRVVCGSLGCCLTFVKILNASQLPGLVFLFLIIGNINLAALLRIGRSNYLLTECVPRNRNT